MKISAFDRHAEHVDPTIPLCPHEEIQLGPGDTGKLVAHFEAPAWVWAGEQLEAIAEIEIRVVGRNHLEVVLNLPDYLAARRVQEERDAEDPRDE